METASNQLSTDQILAAMTRLSLPELDQVFERVLALKAEQKSPHLSYEESSLLSRINQGLPFAMRERIAVLRGKREDHSITDAEYDELTRLTDQSEVLHAERLGAMVELAQVRGVSLPVLMDQLGIHFPENV